MTESRGIKIFLAHASDDKSAVLSLYERLKAQGYDPWLDKLNLLPGDKWREEIPKAITGRSNVRGSWIAFIGLHYSFLQNCQASGHLNPYDLCVWQSE